MLGILGCKTKNNNFNEDQENFEIITEKYFYNDEKRIPELYTGHKPIPINIINKVLKSICKITIKKGNIYGTGFFMNVSESLKYLITNYHIISQDKINEHIEIEIEIYNHKKMNLKSKLDSRRIKYFPRPKDITLIEIKNYDEIYNDIEFLDYDSNYTKKGYKIYQNVDVFSIEHPLGDSAACASGKIININDYEFDHNISTDSGSSGSPIILLNNNINLIQVIGIHKEGKNLKQINCGTFIGEIFNDNNYSLNNKNLIISELIIEDNDVDKEIRIINSYEEYKRNSFLDNQINNDEKNEDEIKKCEIRINNELIPFNYFHKFPEKGKYIIQYSFKKKLTKTNYLFHDCNYLTKLNLSKFNTRNITDMKNMFFGCSSLTNINLSNFNTKNVVNISGMFFNCNLLKNIDLTYFDTENVRDMSYMFYECNSLTNINLANFDTQKVKTMSCMFSGCHSLIDLDLSNFNTTNVASMSGMFSMCKSLKYLNLSNFDTKNVKNMNAIFLMNSSLKKENIITKDNRIFQSFN